LETIPLSPARPSVAQGNSTNDQTLRIDVEVLNRMMNQVGELVLTRNQILQSAPGAANFPELARRLDSITAELRESVMHARMQPVGNLFGKFPRMVRDLAHSCGKRVRIEFDGQATGLDKSLLEAIKDPLTHALRNSIDHGIERPEIRLARGKPVEGVIRLRAFHQNGAVVVEQSDDGAGISIERVLAKGIERGLVTAERAATMTEHAALQLIFAPGFSTAEQVTSISGRGVGMDVVRTNVERVGGSVEIESRPGLGTTLRLRVPLTLAIVPALVVRSGGQSFALPQNTLIELVYVAAADAERAVERMGTAELYRLRDRLLPLVWLDRLLELEPCASAKGFYIAVLDGDGCRFGLVVDDLMAPEEIVVKPLSSVLRQIGLFSGATVLGNGLLAMILDVPAIAAYAGMLPPAESASHAAGAVLPELLPPHSDAPGVLGPMVIYETPRRGIGQRGGQFSERTALPLSRVERIEMLPVSEIEYAGGRPVLQYRGGLLPLQDEDDLLYEMRPQDTVTILICDPAGLPSSTPEDRSQESRRRVGIVVGRVLDVCAGTAMESDATPRDGLLAMVNGRVTTVQSELPGTMQIQDTSIWQEVA
jgi:two-component system chemotaxis sensor kinase CheA